MTQLSIAILGAGIAGLCAAIALHKKGFKVSLYERSPKIRGFNNNGAGLVLWPNASSILAKLDLLDEIKSTGYTLDSIKRYNQSGEFLNDIRFNPTDSKSKDDTNYYNYAVRRKTLITHFLNQITKLDIDILYDSRVSSIKSSSHQGTRIYFDNAIEITADIVIGADGRMNSVARKYVTGNNSAIYQGYVNWVGLIEHQSGITFDKTIVDYWGCGERFAFVPLSKNSAYWAGCKTLPENLGIPESGNKTTLFDIFKAWPEIIQSILAQSKPHTIRRIEVFDHDPITSWHRNNVCLIGDAAHAALPTSGQGACQAIEDAYYLAEQLAKLQNNRVEDYQTAFKQFYNQRFEVNRNITENARILTRSIFNTDPEICRDRDQKAKNNHKIRE